MKEQTLSLGLYNISFHWQGEEEQNATISSDLTSKATAPHHKVAISAIETLILSHFRAGVDILAPDYLKATEKAIEAILANQNR
ncbi:hypothetical protein [Photobacterium rosenbergii]|uniref:WYL domain-containing protein n=1 Tax=Photobacterium rosenbergii TaxID=294936 RepID=A0ABU3ZLT0_9GAMM|nr:hypothetical protein [Photobacterium rosenbergii]MDV5170979.1 hypothetical protein [Photobacterium rosenbergii]